MFGATLRGMVKELPPTAPRIRALREAIGLAQEALANAAGIARTHVVHLERGPLKASRVEMRRKLATAFGLSLEIVNEYLDGHIELAGVLRARRRGMRSGPEAA